MTASDLPPPVQALIASCVVSMDHVEVLRFLADRPNALSTTREVAEGTRLDARLVARVVQDLVAGKLLRADGDTLAFQPATADREAVTLLIQMYETRPVTLVRAIYARPAPVRAFADAFRLRRDD